MDKQAIPPLHKFDLPNAATKRYAGKGGNISPLPAKKNGSLTSPGQQKAQKRRGK